MTSKKKAVQSKYQKDLKAQHAFPATAEAAEQLQKLLTTKPQSRTQLAKRLKVSKPWLDRLLVLVKAKRLPASVRQAERGRAADGFVRA